VAAGFRHLRSVPLLPQITTVTAVAFSVIGLNETIIFAVIAQGLHRPPSFFGVYGAVQGAGAIAGGIPLAPLVRRLGSARVVGFSLAAFSLASAACMTGSLWLILAAAVADGIGLVWLVPPATMGRSAIRRPRQVRTGQCGVHDADPHAADCVHRCGSGVDLGRRHRLMLARRAVARVRACPTRPSVLNTGRLVELTGEAPSTLADAPGGARGGVPA
jgi:hypothetical protein